MSTAYHRARKPFQPRRPAVDAVLGSLRWLEKVMTARRQRRSLLALDDVTLKDIGLSRADAEREASRRFWDVG